MAVKILIQTIMQNRLIVVAPLISLNQLKTQNTSKINKIITMVYINIAPTTITILEQERAYTHQIKQ